MKFTINKILHTDFILAKIPSDTETDIIFTTNEHNCEPNWLSKQINCSNSYNAIRISVRWIDPGNNKPSFIKYFC